MTEFDDFCSALQELVDRFGKRGTHLRIKMDGDAIRILGEGATALSQARRGAEEIEELASATAEHHPYWNLLYQCAQITEIVLDRWDDEIAGDEADQIRWSISELDGALRRLHRV